VRHMEMIPVDEKESIQSEAKPETRLDLSTSLQGLPIVISTCDGLRYAVLLGSPNILKWLDRF
jgi:hypothetical protein